MYSEAIPSAARQYLAGQWWVFTHVEPFVIGAAALLGWALLLWMDWKSGRRN